MAGAQDSGNAEDVLQNYLKNLSLLRERIVAELDGIHFKGRPFCDSEASVEVLLGPITCEGVAP